MGLCDPKAVRAGRPWYMQVNEPGYMQGRKPGTLAPPKPACDTKSSVNDTKEKTDDQQ